MYLRKFFLLMIFLFVLFLSGCTIEHRRYVYEYNDFDLFDGIFSVEIVHGLPMSYKENGFKKIYIGAPYTLVFVYRINETEPLARLEVKDIQLIGYLDESNHMLPDIQSDKIRTFGGPGVKSMHTGYDLKDVEKYKYQDYTLKAKVVVHSTENIFHEKSISILIKTAYNRGYSSVLFDRLYL